MKDGQSCINTGCTLVDCNKITIGNNVLIAPNVQIYTATHPIELNERLTPTETPDGIEYVRHTYALPVTIEDGCWIGGGVIILPGVTIGRGSVIGAGSVVAICGHNRCPFRLYPSSPTNHSFAGVYGMPSLCLRPKYFVH